MNVEDVGRLVDEHMEHEAVAGEILNRNTVDDGFGHFITTVIYRTTPVVVAVGGAGPKQSITSTGYLVFIDGKAISGGSTDAEWSDV